MADIPLHKAVQQSDFGIFAKEVSPFSPNRLINYTHRDSYYIFGIVESGTCRVGIDFKDCDLSAGSVICTSRIRCIGSLIKGMQSRFSYSSTGYL